MFTKVASLFKRKSKNIYAMPVESLAESPFQQHDSTGSLTAYADHLTVLTSTLGTTEMPLEGSDLFRARYKMMLTEWQAVQTAMIRTCTVIDGRYQSEGYLGFESVIRRHLSQSCLAIILLGGAEYIDWHPSTNLEAYVNWVRSKSIHHTAPDTTNLVIQQMARAANKCSVPMEPLVAALGTVTTPATVLKEMEIIPQCSIERQILQVLGDLPDIMEQIRVTRIQINRIQQEIDLNQSALESEQDITGSNQQIMINILKHIAAKTSDIQHQRHTLKGLEEVLVQSIIGLEWYWDLDSVQIPD